MSVDNVYGTPRNGDSVALTSGMVVRINANNTVVRAEADALIDLPGLCGIVASGSVAPGGPVNVVTNAFGQLIRLETGLTLAAGDTLYVSGTTPGVCTNVAPANAVPIGAVLDTRNYATTSMVLGTINTPPDSFPIFPGVSAPAGFMAIETPVIDFTATPALYTFNMPRISLVGWYGIVNYSLIFLTQTAGALSVAPTLQAGNDVSFLNLIASTTPALASTFAAGAPAALRMTTGPAVAQLIDLSTPPKLDVTAAATGTTLTLKAKVGITLWLSRRT